MEGHVLEKPRYSFEKDGYQGIRPEFYDPKQFSWVNEIEQNWVPIKQEILAFIEDSKSLAVTGRNKATETGWKSVYLNNFMWENHRVIKKLKNTTKLLEQLPNCPFAVISVIEPHSSIPAHHGDTNTVIRSMLGIKIPKPFPTIGIRVGDKKQGWEEGKVLLFSECYEHEAWNHSDERRIVLVFDVMREEYLPQKKLICSKVLAKQTVLEFQIIFKLKKMPLLLNTILFHIFTILWLVYLPIHNKLKLPFLAG